MVNHKIVEALAALAVPITSVKLLEKNPRSHGDKSIAGIKASLNAFGQRKPIIVNKNTNVIIAGNGTYTAALALNWTHIAAVLVNDDDETARAFAMADNRTAELSVWDPDVVAVEVADLNISDAAISQMLVELAQSLEGGTPIVPEATTTEPVKLPEMELVPYEHYDYLIILAKHQSDWNWLMDKFKIKKVKLPWAKTKVGLGRAIWAGDAIKIIIGENNADRPENRGTEQGTPKELGDDKPAAT